MRELKQTRVALASFLEKMDKEIDGIYDINAYRTVDAMKDLIENENVMLLKLQQEAYTGIRDVACDGLVNDGIEHPKTLWAKRVGTQIARPFFSSIHQELPVAELVDEKQPDPARGAGMIGKNMKKVFYATAAGGAVVTIISLGFSPISGWLLGIGLAVTIGGALLAIAPCADGSRQESSRATAPAPSNDAEVSAAILSILNEQRKQNKEILHRWCNVDCLRVIQTAVDAEEATDKEG